jgi:hypothetical protein
VAVKDLGFTYTATANTVTLIFGETKTGTWDYTISGTALTLTRQPSVDVNAGGFVDGTYYKPSK